METSINYLLHRASLLLSLLEYFENTLECHRSTTSHTTTPSTLCSLCVLFSPFFFFFFPMAIVFNLRTIFFHSTQIPFHFLSFHLHVSSFPSQIHFPTPTFKLIYPSFNFYAHPSMYFQQHSTFRKALLPSKINRPLLQINYMHASFHILSSYYECYFYIIPS